MALHSTLKVLFKLLYGYTKRAIALLLKLSISYIRMQLLLIQPLQFLVNFSQRCYSCSAALSKLIKGAVKTVR